MNPLEAQNLLKEFRYDNSNDVNMRLKGTILRYKGRPVYCSGAIDDVRISIEYIDGQDTASPFVVHSSDVDLDISSVPLGWVNLKGYSLFLMRSARNSQKQGVNPGSLVYFDPHPRGGRSTSRFHFENRHELFSIGAAVAGKYPSFRIVLGLEQGGAFHADWAVIKPRADLSSTVYTLFHKTTAVGVFSKKTGQFTFRRGRLTKTRLASLKEVLADPVNSKEGLNYGIAEQK